MVADTSATRASRAVPRAPEAEAIHIRAAAPAEPGAVRACGWRETVRARPDSSPGLGGSFSERVATEATAAQRQRLFRWQAGSPVVQKRLCSRAKREALEKR